MQPVGTTAPVTAAYVATVNRARCVVDRRLRSLDRERGLTTTEVAVLTFILVSIAAAIGVLIYNYAKGNVDNLDNVGVDPTGGGDLSTDTN